MMSMKDTSDKSVLKDVLLNDAAALRSMYVEFAYEDRELAQLGLASYTRLLEEEDFGSEAAQRRHDGG